MEGSFRDEADTTRGLPGNRGVRENRKYRRTVAFLPELLSDGGCFLRGGAQGEAGGGTGQVKVQVKAILILFSAGLAKTS